MLLQNVFMSHLCSDACCFLAIFFRNVAYCKLSEPVCCDRCFGNKAWFISS